MTLPNSPALARCAVHPEVPAILTCPYCGSFACPECIIRTPWNELLCRDCKAARRGVYPIPWDFGEKPWTTAQAAARTPKIFFGSFPRDPTRSLARPLALACLGAALMSTAVFIGILPFALSMPDARDRLVAALALVTWGPSFGIAGGAAAAVSTATLSRLFGGAIANRSALRACFYSRGAWLVAAPAVLLAALPLVGVLVVMAGFAAQLAYELNVLRWLARRAGVTPTRAWLVALLSTAFGVVLGYVTLSVARAAIWLPVHFLWGGPL
jgi:hypothetical protein